jgi:hypothetical protein
MVRPDGQLLPEVATFVEVDASKKVDIAFLRQDAARNDLRLSFG